MWSFTARHENRSQNTGSHSGTTIRHVLAVRAVKRVRESGRVADARPGSFSHLPEPVRRDQWQASQLVDPVGDFNGGRDLARDATLRSPCVGLDDVPFL